MRDCILITHTPTHMHTHTHTHTPLWQLFFINPHSECPHGTAKARCIRIVQSLLSFWKHSVFKW